jgi:hypothetical protein
MMVALKPWALRLSILALLVAVTPAAAQFRAGIQGTVTDQTGAVVNGATVTATDKETGRSTTATTSEDGFYRISGLPPGTYTIKVEGKSFKTVTSTVQVAAENIAGFNATLPAGAASESVSVTASTPIIDTESGDVGATLSNEQIQGLPATGRDPYELLRLAPGIFADGSRSAAGQAISLPNNAGPNGSNTSIFQVENQVQISANGQRVSANNYEVDGVNVNSLTWGGAAVITPGLESVKEIRVTSSTYSAEDGRNSGAQVKVVSQTGTNGWHGSGFFKYDQPGLNAYNSFTNIGGDTIGTLKCNPGPGQFTITGTRCPDRVQDKFRNFGGSVGGPIKKDKLFFFFAVEALKSNNSSTSGPVFVETPQFRSAIAAQRASTVTAAVMGAQGIAPRILTVLAPSCTNFTNAGRPCAIVGNGIDIGSITGAYNQYVSLGTPQGGGLDGVPDLQIVQVGFPGSVNGQQYNGRIDYYRGKDQFAVSAFISRQDSVSADPSAQGRPIADLNFQPLSPSLFLSWIRPISSTMLNEARFNFTRFAFNQVSSNSNVNFGIPRVEIEGLPIGDRLRFGSPQGETSPGVFAQNTYAFRDTLTKQYARMALKTGFEFRAEQDNNNLLGGSRPDYSFSGLFNFANGTPIFEGINADPRNGRPANAQRYFRTKDYGLFIQTDWKLRQNLTVNLGLRYEYFTPLREVNGQLVNLALGTGPQALANATLKVTDQLTNPDRNNFAPRLGFAWSPGLLQNKTVLRGGVGVSYNRVPDVLFANTRGNPPFFARFGLCCGTAATDFGTPFDGGKITFVQGANNSVDSYPTNPALAQGIDPSTGLPIGGAVEAWGAPQNFPMAYTYNYSLETETQLPYKLVLGLGYEGSNTRKLVRIINLNFIYDVLNPHFFQVFFPTPDVNANYNSLNLRVARSFNKGFQVEAKYRWSRSIDALSNEGPGFQTNQTFPRDLRFERGPSDFDATHFAVLSGIWEIPLLRNRKDLLGTALGGWKLGGIFTARSGFPWTPVTFTQQLKFPGGSTLGPIRPVAYKGGAGSGASTDVFLRKNGNFPGGGQAFFDITSAGTPGIGRNSFRGPRYGSMDLSVAKNTAFPIPGRQERANLELRANLFNAFNKLNLAPFGFATPSTVVENSHFGQATSALAGRVVEFQARVSF